MKTVRQTGKDLMAQASTADRTVLQNQLDELEGLWNRTSKLCEKRTDRLEDALRQVSFFFFFLLNEKKLFDAYSLKLFLI